jgi:Bacterial Ig-like domain (group 2)
MPEKEDENKSGESWLSKKIVTITTIVLVLTGLVSALVGFRDSIPWLTPVATIELAPNPLNLAIGDKFHAIATVRDSHKNPLGKSVKWSTANPDLLEIDSDGIITGKASGDTTIAASIGFIKGIASVHVRHVNVAMVEVFPPATTLQVDDHLKFDATPYDSEGNSLMGRRVRWASDDNSVAFVDEATGDATAKSSGAAKVTAVSEGKLNSASVTVSPKQAPLPTAETPAPTAPPATAPPPAATGRGRIGAEIGRVARGPAGVVRVPPPVASAARTMSLASAAKITIVNGLKTGNCLANIRILIGKTLIDVKSDPQEAVGIALGDQPYNLHGTVSCHQNVVVVNGRGTVSIVNGKTYRCAWIQKGSKDFEIALQPQ